jgi:DNA-binding response OmpR family regulator
MKILLIEPDRLLAGTYKKALEQASHSVVVASTAQAAIHAADDLQPDLVILELQLVSHSGIEFLYEFRSYADWQAIPVVVVSNVPPGEFADSWQLLREELGVQNYHYKPRTTLRALLRTVDSFAPVSS